MSVLFMILLTITSLDGKEIEGTTSFKYHEPEPDLISHKEGDNYLSETLSDH